jgi:hypothetical protein
MEVHINFLAIFLAALASYVIAAVWYAVLFSKLWKKLTGIEEMKPSPVKMVIVFAGSLVMSFVLYHNIVFGNAFFHMSGITGGVMGGFFGWLGFIAPVTLTNVIYEKRPAQLWLLDLAFWFISLIVMGIIISFWQ